jgi:hypothetical protein
MRTLLIPSLLALAGSAASGQGAEPAPPPAAPPLAKGSLRPQPPRVIIKRLESGRPVTLAFGVDSVIDNRATLGMQLSATGSKRDTIGVFVARVVPDGPAERAGIVEGDRIVSINDVDLRTSIADLDDPYTAGIPAHRVRREVVKLQAGAPVSVRVYSQGKIKTVTIMAGKRSDVIKRPPMVHGIGSAATAQLRMMPMPPDAPMAVSAPLPAPVLHMMPERQLEFQLRSAMPDARAGFDIEL